MASLSPAAIGALADRAREGGTGFVASPVLGRPNLAAAGQLNILAAGDEWAVATVTPYLELMGKRVWPLGLDPRRAAVVKIAVNYNVIDAIQTLGESISLVEANGVEPTKFVELLSNTLFGGVSHTAYGDIVANRRHSPAGFSMQLGRKDLRLAQQVATDAGFELPTAATIAELFETALADDELADKDWGALAEVTRRRVPKAG